MIEIRINGFTCDPQEIEVGAAGSYGMQKLHFAFSAEWEGLAKRTTWVTDAGRIKVLLDSSDCCDVPAEATATAGRRYFSIDGMAEGKHQISARAVYKVRETIEPGGENSSIPTEEEILQALQILEEVKALKTPAVDVGTTKTVEAGSPAKVKNIGTETKAVFEFEIPRGESGVYAGRDEPGEDVQLWIVPEGENEVDEAIVDIESSVERAETEADRAETAATCVEAAADRTEAAAIRVETATLNAPKVENGNWWVYDAAQEAYTDTGVQAKGPAGEPGNGIRNMLWMKDATVYEDDRVVARKYKLYITLDDGSTTEFTVEGGADGKPGLKGDGISDIRFSEETDDGYLYYARVGVTTYPILIPRGPAGADGKTPVKGTDYWTSTDKAEIVEEVLAEVPSGGASSWNDLTDKPFSEVYGDTLTWDGNIDGLVSVDGAAYKISDATPSVDEVMSGSLTATVDGETGTMPLVDYPPTEMGSGVALYLYAFLVVPESAVGVDIQGLVFPEAGLYVVPAMAGAVLNSLTIPGYTGFKTETINTDCIPDTIQRTITGTPGDFVVIGEDGKVTTVTLVNVSEEGA